MTRARLHPSRASGATSTNVNQWHRRPVVRVMFAVAGVATAVLSGYTYGVNQRPSSCGEAIETAQAGFTRTSDLIVLFEAKMDLAQQMLVAVDDRDQAEVQRLQSRIDAIDRQMESAAADIGTAQTQLNQQADQCA